MVDSQRLRFDFSHGEPVSSEVLAQVTQVVNEQIRKNAAVSTDLMSMDAAIEAGVNIDWDDSFCNAFLPSGGKLV